ncbi:MAG: polysaccharide biosynthesis C-terminal domain-containing protein [Pseudomonadota bacterium]
MAGSSSRLKIDLFIGLALRGAGAVSSFALAWLMAQLFGARVVGLYQIGFTTATLLGAIALLGHDLVLVRQISPLLRDEKFGESSGLFRAARWFVVKSGLGLAMMTAIFAYPLAIFALGEEAAASFIIALSPMVALLPMMRVQNSLLRCQGDVKLSQSLEGVLYTSLAVAFLGLAWLAVGELDPLFMPIAVIAGQVIAVSIGYVMVARYLRGWPEGDGSADPKSGAWIAAPQILTRATPWLILLMITAAIDATWAGIFRVAVLICMLMELVWTSFATMTGPYLSRAAEAGDIGQMRKVVLTAGGIGIVLCSPVGLVVILAPEWVLSLFGDEFVVGAMALQLLALAEIFNVLAGPLGIALVMQNREHLPLYNEVVASVGGLVVAVLLLPSWGIAGAAMGMLVASVLRNGANAAFMYFTMPAASLQKAT